MTYRTFKRSPRSWGHTGTAAKRYVERNLTHEAAVTACRTWDANRTPEQKRRGVHLEFEEEK